MGQTTFTVQLSVVRGFKSHPPQIQALTLPISSYWIRRIEWEGVELKRLRIAVINLL
ncbi:MAG: hypothetical protein QXK69_03140 [Candidatus Caldarchaeum sp.]